MRLETAGPLVLGGLVFLIFGWRLTRRRDRLSLSMTAFGVLTIIGGELFVLWEMMESKPVLRTGVESALVLVAVLTAVVGLEIIDARYLARLAGIGKELIAVAYVAPLIFAAASGIYMTIYGHMYSLALLGAVGCNIVIGFVGVAIVRKGPLKFILPLANKAVLAQVIGLMLVGTGGGLIISDWTSIDVAFHIMDVGFLTVLFGAIVKAHLQDVSITHFSPATVVIVNREYDVVMTIIGGTIIQGQLAEGMQIARAIVNTYREPASIVFKTGRTILSPSTTIDALGPQRRFLVEICPHHYDENGTIQLVRITLTEVTATTRYAEAEQLAALLDIVITERNEAETYLDIITHHVANRLQALSLGIEMLAAIPDLKEEHIRLLTDMTEVIDSTVDMIMETRSKRSRHTLPVPTQPQGIKDAVEQALMVVKIGRPQLTLHANVHISRNYVVAGGALLSLALSMLFHYCVNTQGATEVSIRVLASLEEDIDTVTVRIGYFCGPRLKDASSTLTIDMLRWKSQQTITGLEIAYEIARRVGGDLLIEPEEKGQTDPQQKENHSQRYQFVLTLPHAG